jgi:hypothetical protein
MTEGAPPLKSLYIMCQSNRVCLIYWIVLIPVIWTFSRQLNLEEVSENTNPSPYRTAT